MPEFISQALNETASAFKPNNTKPPMETKAFPLFSLKGRTAIVTGAGAGIGLAAAEAFAEAGANVAIWYNSNTEAITRAEEIAKEYNVKCCAYKVKITDKSIVERAVEEAIRDLNGRLDIFVANAGMIWQNGPVDISTTTQFQELLDLNVNSVLYCSLVAGKHFLRQKETRQTIDGRTLDDYSSGSLIITSSIASKVTVFPQAATPYNMSKAAVTHYCKSLAVEWAHFARVNIVSPGYVMTGLLDNTPLEVRELWAGRTPMGREGSCHEMKGAYLFLASDASSFATGTDLVIDGGMSLL